MLTFRLNVFESVAEHLSFTKAAEELCISQPAVTRHVKELEAEKGMRLIERKGSQIALTKSGEILLRYIKKARQVEQELAFEMSVLKDQLSGILRLGASTTIAQYVLPTPLSMFYNRYPQVQIEVQSGNTHTIEEALLAGKIDIGIVEGLPNNKVIKYAPVIKDEIVAAVKTSGSLSNTDTLSVKSLLKHPMVLRERGSGTLDIFYSSLKEQLGIKPTDLNVVLQLDSTEAIKSFVKSTDCIGFFSVPSIITELQSGLLKIVDIENLMIERNFYLIYPQGPEPEGLSSQFIKFLKHHQAGRKK